MMNELITPPGISLIKFSTIKSPPNPLKTKENKDAPIRMKKTIDEIFMVSSDASIREITLILFFIDKKIEPKAPNDADSVGVAIPNKIDPKTIIIKLTGGIIILKILYREILDCFKLLLIGKILGLKEAHIKIHKK